MAWLTSCPGASGAHKVILASHWSILPILSSHWSTVVSGPGPPVSPLTWLTGSPGFTVTPSSGGCHRSSSSHWSMLLILASHWSQVLKFILRPQPHLRALLQATEEHFNHPIVGVHIRRTDKVALMNEEWKMDSDILTRLELRQHFTLWRSTWLTCWNGSGSRD